MPRPSRATTLTLGYLGLAAVDAWLAGGEHPRAHYARRITKPLLMPLLSGSLAGDAAAAASPLRTTTLFGQGFGWGGDLCLLGEGTAAFAAGAGSFGVGHVAYITGFRRNRRRDARLSRNPVARVAAVLTAIAGPVLAHGAAREDKRLAPAVVGYSALLSSMLANAAHLDPSLPRRARLMTLTGAVLFTASDSLLGATRFTGLASRIPAARAETIVMLTYTGGQLLISKGAAAAAR